MGRDFKVKRIGGAQWAFQVQVFEARNSSVHEKGGISLLCSGQMGVRCRLTLLVEFKRCVVENLVVHANLSEQSWEID